MCPVIFKFGIFTIYSYGFMLAVAFMTSSALLRLQAKKQEMDTEIIFNLLFIVLISGIIGARIFYIIENLDYYLGNPLETVMLQRGGLSWFGGLALGVISTIIYAKRKRLSLYKIFDLIVPFLALAQAIGRIGCLLNGCCFGRASAYGIYFKVHQAVLIPTQIYSSLSLILIFIILRFLQERPHQDGKILFSYLLLYSLKRFLIEFWRADNPRLFFDLTLFQMISIAIFIFATIKLFLLKKS